MKYIKYIIFCSLVSGLFCLKNPIRSVATDSFVNTSSYGTALFEVSSEHLIVGKNENEKLYPASMTKMMGMLLVLEDIENKKYTMDSIVVVSETAASMGGSQIFLEVGEKMSVEDLFKSVAICSANDAITALAENSSGSVEAFVDKMNKKAKILGMQNTNFVNPTGFFDKDHYSSPYDMGILAIHLIKKYGPIVLKYTSQYENYVRENTSNPFWLVTTNKMMRSYSGMDGLKTGYISESGYCLTATATRNNVRMVSVVMKSSSIEKRSKDTKALLDYGFSLYKSSRLFKENTIVSTYDFKNAKTKKTPLKVKDDVDLIHLNDKNISSYIYKIVMTKTKAPIKKDEKIGILNVYDNGSLLATYDLFSDASVEEKSFWYKFVCNLKDILF